MKRFIVVLLAVCGLFVYACGSGGGGGGGDKSKSLFSLWHDTVDDSPLDLTSGAFGVDMLFSVWTVDGSQCNCTLRLMGDQSSGDYVLNSCYYVVGSGSGDPGCADMNDTGTFTKSSDTLTICNSSNDCDKYK